MARLLMLAVFVLLCGCSEHLPERDYSMDAVRTVQGVHVVGDDLTEEDIEQILLAVRSSPLDFDKRVLTVYQEEVETVEVLTGEIRGPLNGGGDSITLRKIDGIWIVMEGETAKWVS